MLTHKFLILTGKEMFFDVRLKNHHILKITNLSFNIKIIEKISYSLHIDIKLQQELM